MGSIAENEFSYEDTRLLVTAIEDKAKWYPNNTYLRYPGSDWRTAGYKTISWIQYLHAIDKVAYWLDEKLGKAKGNETIAYSGPDDPRYAIIVPAAIKTGRKILVPDGRVTKEGLQDLVESTQSKAWIVAEDDVRESLIGEDSELQSPALPSLESILKHNADNHVPYPYNKTFRQASRDLIIIIHTSGTTGMPKPIYHTNAMWSIFGNAHLISQRHWPRGIAHESWLGRSCLNCCAPQWLAGLHIMMAAPAFDDSPCIMLPPDPTGLTPEIFKEVLKLNHVEGIKCPPHTIELLYADPEARALLKSLKFVLYLGAQLDRAVGDDLCQFVRLTSLIGSTETGDQLSIRPADRKLWYTHSFIPENGSRMVKIDDESSDLHELVLERPKDGSENIFQAAFWNPAFDGMDQIWTKELYAPVPDSDGTTRWKFSARKDDLTKLNWLAKFHAQDIESRIQQHRSVKSVFVGGEGRPAPCVIIDFKEGFTDGQDTEKLIDEVYMNAIVGVNKSGIDEIRIPRETVFATKKEKPFKRNLKQVIRRKEVESDYEAEIEEAYLLLAKTGQGKA